MVKQKTRSRLLLSSCEGETWAQSVVNDMHLGLLVAWELFGQGTDLDDAEKEEAAQVTKMLIEDGEARFEDGCLELRNGGIK